MHPYICFFLSSFPDRLLYYRIGVGGGRHTLFGGVFMSLSHVIGLSGRSELVE